MVKKLKEIAFSGDPPADIVARMQAVLSGYLEMEEVRGILAASVGKKKPADADRLIAAYQSGEQFDLGGHFSFLSKTGKGITNLTHRKKVGTLKPQTVLTVLQMAGFANASCEMAFIMDDGLRQGDSVTVVVDETEKKGTLISKPNPFEWWVMVGQQPTLVQLNNIKRQ